MGQRVDVTLPVPRSLPLAGALAWAAREFERFRGQGWDIEGEWTLDMGTEGWRGRQGELRFWAVYGRETGLVFGRGEGEAGRHADVVVGVEVRADGCVRWHGELSQGQRHAVLTALGVAELVGRAGSNDGGSSSSSGR